MSRVRVLLVDDSPAFLALAARLLTDQFDVDVVGSALSGAAALMLVARLSPDLVLLDFAMQGMNGLAVTRQLKALPTPPRVVILTLYDVPEYRAACLEAGADGFVTKQRMGTDLRPILASLHAPASAGTPPA